jgi:hypothetical protein
MWPRVVELMFGVWLILSPFIFQTALGEAPSAGSLVCGAIVVIASCLSYWPPTRHARAITGAVGVWLTGSAYLTATYPAEPAVQNHMLVGLLLIMFAIIPNEAAKPPVSWRPFVSRPDDLGECGDPPEGAR